MSLLDGITIPPDVAAIEVIALIKKYRKAMTRDGLIKPDGRPRGRLAQEELSYYESYVKELWHDNFLAFLRNREKREEEYHD